MPVFSPNSQKTDGVAGSVTFTIESFSCQPHVLDVNLLSFAMRTGRQYWSSSSDVQQQSAQPCLALIV